MRSATWMLGLTALTCAGLVACSSSTTSTTPGTLGFTVAESLLVLFPDDPTSGFALLSGGTGTCAALQSGIDVVNTVEIANFAYVAFLLGELDANGNSLPLGGGTYTIVDPNGGTFTPPGLLANAAGVATDSQCNAQISYAASGTAVLSNIDGVDGGATPFNYSAVFGSQVVTGTYSLATCLVTSGVDAGVCVPCLGPDGTVVTDGGVCAIQ
jgi:hypothetical protein